MSRSSATGSISRADWGSVDCEVLAVEPNKTLSYTWAAMGLEERRDLDAHPDRTGTHLRMEQSGFRPDQKQAYGGARMGWPQFLRNWSRFWPGRGLKICRAMDQSII